MSVLNLVTDRAEADVNRVKYLNSKTWESMTAEEQNEWIDELKGAYNASDLNRVETAVEYLAQALRELPQEMRDYATENGVAWDAFFDVPYDSTAYNPTVKKDWTQQTIQTQQDMERYLSNVVLLRNALTFDTDTLPASMENLTVDAANAIERALVNLDAAIILLRNDTQTLIDNTAAAWFYSGDIYTGEVTA